jgi:2-polyprenyl-6-methoxyphenol hydroxylase-like FAD-dependent oxidoreductase
MKPLTIIGGGLAGLTLGIALRKEGVPVTLHEAGQYPRHRVCGEFLSGQGMELLKGLGVYEQAMAAGAREARTLKFFAEDAATEVMSMPAPALCISRYRLDAILAETFRAQGGDLRTGSRYADGYGEGLVRATGRQVQTEVEGWRWIGIKAHALDLELEADLEMHLRSDAYVGLCRVEEDRVNVCGLFRTREPTPDLKSTWQKWLMGNQKFTLTKKLSNITFDKESLSVVAGLPIRPFQNSDSEVLSVGDAVTMIPPVTGNGMSLAIESACAAAPQLRDYSRAKTSWQATQTLVRQDYTRRYGRRLQWAGWLQRGVVSPLGRDMMMRTVPVMPALFRFGFGVTRG